MKRLDSIYCAIIVTIAALALNSWLNQQAEPVPADAPATEFSGERAMTMLREFLAEDEPHPVGSNANQRVKQRIKDWLSKEGISFEEQRAWACAQKYPSCSSVENIIAVLPGQVAGPHVAMMAHYDSVPHAPGAGDDMAGVVAVLEAARAAKAVGDFRHPIALLITDSEETGLHGAHAFFQQHPLAENIGVLLNVEGSGTRGVSQVLRTAGANRWYMELFEDHAKQPAGTSLANEIFKRMPNDTDFSVAMAASVPGIDFAFAAERNHYHTMNDSVANLDPRTVQHHGDNLFPLVLELANSSLEATDDSRAVYHQTYGLWAQWPEWASWFLIAISIALLMVATVRSAVSPVHLLCSALLLPAGLIIAGGSLVHLCFFVLEQFNGTTVSWPAHLWPFRLVLFAAALLPMLLTGLALAQRITRDIMLLGAYWFLAVLCIILRIYVPDGVSPFLVALLPSAALLAVASTSMHKSAVKAALLLLTLVFSSQFLGAALLLEDTQGFRLLPAIWPWVSLFAVSALAFARGRALRSLAIGTVTVLIGSMTSAVALPLYSPWRPQHINIWYLEDSVADKAYLNPWTDGELPQAMLAASDFEHGQNQIPWIRSLDHLASTDSAGFSPPTLTLEADEREGDYRNVRLRIRSTRGAWQIRLYLPASLTYWEGDVAGSPIKSRRSKNATSDDPSTDFERLAFFGTQSSDVVLTLKLTTAEAFDAWLVDFSPSLPDEAMELVRSRPKTALPVHGGDASISYTRVRI